MVGIARHRQAALRSDRWVESSTVPLVNPSFALPSISYRNSSLATPRLSRSAPRTCFSNSSQHVKSSMWTTWGLPISISTLASLKWWGHRICEAVTAQSRLTCSMAVSNCSLNPTPLEFRSRKQHPKRRSHSPDSPTNAKPYEKMGQTSSYFRLRQWGHTFHPRQVRGRSPLWRAVLMSMRRIRVVLHPSKGRAQPGDGSPSRERGLDVWLPFTPPGCAPKFILFTAPAARGSSGRGSWSQHRGRGSSSYRGSRRECR
jgi:hypothetical protein